MNYRTLPNGDTVASPNELPAMLEAEEGYLPQSGPQVYDDKATGHNPTIGYGFNLRTPSVLALVLKNFTYNGINVFTQASNTSGYTVNGVIPVVVAAFENLIGQYPANNFASQGGIAGAINSWLGSYWNLSPAQSLNLLTIPKSLAQSIVSQIVNGYTVGDTYSVPSIYQLLTNYLTANGVSAGNVPPVNSAEALALGSLFYNNGSLLGQGLRNALQAGNRAQVWYQIRYQSNSGWTAGDTFHEGIAKRRDYESQVFNLSSSSDSLAQAYQNYEMLTENRAKIIQYEKAYGEPPGQPASAKDAIALANGNYGLSSVSSSPVSQAVQNLVQTFNADATIVAQNINQTYSYLAPNVNISTALGNVSNAFNVGSTDILVAPSQADLTSFFASHLQENINAASADPNSSNHILIGVTTGDTLTGGAGSDIIIAGSGSETLSAGTGTETLIGGQGSDLLNGGVGRDVFDIEFASNPAPTTATETIVSANGNGSLYINGAKIGAGLTSTGVDTWTDGTYNYQFIKGTNIPSGDLQGITFDPANFAPWVGELKISPASLLNTTAGTINVIGFDLHQAESTSFLGINLPASAYINYTANQGVDPPDLGFVEGSNQSYTLSVDAPSTTAQAFTVALSGASSSDFEAMVGNTVSQLNANGTFNVTLAAGETSVAFTLLDVTGSSGSSDIASGTTLQLSASLPNPDTLVGGSIQAGALTFNYIPTPPDTGAAPQNLTTIAGTLNGGVTDYEGDGGNDYIAAGAGPNLINASNSINDSITGGTGTNTIYGGSGNDVTVLFGSQDYVSLGNGFNTLSGGTGQDTIYTNNATAIVTGNNGRDVIIAGDGTNEIYAGTKTGLAAAIAAAAVATPTGLQGDLLAVGDGDNTIVGSNGNDLITTDDSFQNGMGGNDVVVLGAGNDTYFGGVPLNSATGDWSVTQISGGLVQFNNTSGGPVDYTNPYLQPYNGITLNGLPVGAGNVTVYGGTGNYLLELPNGNNYVNVGSGNSSVYGGMGNDTVIAGSGIDFIRGGGGTTYIAGGSGTSTLIGGDGSNTIIGGTGNSTIYSSSGPNGLIDFANDTLDHNYVNGGSGNDLIYGSAGQDTLIAGTGNTTIHGQTGNELIVGGSGNDFLTGGIGNSTISAGGSGLDTLFAFGSSTTTSYLYGGSGTDLIESGSGVNVINAGDGGTAGAATSVFASQSDATATTTITGGLGIDFLEAGIGATVIYGGSGGTGGAPTTLIGWTGADTLVGGLGTDVIYGGTGSTDVLYAGDGGTAAAPTTVVSGTGVDSLYGGAGSSVLEDVSSGRDLLVSGTANDSLVGTGSDTLVAGTGNDVMQGNGGSVNFELNAGFGNDSVQSLGGTENLLLGSGILVTDFSGAVGFDAAGNSYLDLSGDGGTIAIEGGLTGALASAQYVGSSAIPLLTLITDALGGDQTVAAASGSNFIVNLANNESVSSINAGDSISSWGTGDTINGSSLYTHVYSTGASAQINSAGYNVINAAGTNDTVHGGSYGGDAITLSGGNSLASVGAALNGNATTSITASGANDTVVAGSGSVASVITVNDASTVIQVAAGAGTTAVSASVSYTAPTNVTNLTLIGTANIAATGNTGADVLTGGAGSDTLIAGSGVNTLIGGAGNTTFVVNNTGDVVQDSSTTVNNTVQSSVNFVLPTNVNILVLTGTSALTGTANGGNDTLVSNTGVDTLIGGTGNDTFILNNVADVVIDTAGTATIVYAASANFTLPANVNTLTLLGTAAIVATGNAGNDSITANTGADTLIAGNGNDTLVSGISAAVDSLVGGTGNDLFVVNATGDIVTVGGTHGTDTIQSSVSYTASANVANLTLIGSGNIVATGNSLANVLTANTGNDTLVAGSGLATLVGGPGNDTFVLNNAGDVIQDTSTTSSNTIQANFNYTLPTFANSLLLTGTGALIGTANSGDDTLTSNSGADTLIGGSGNETFIINNSSDVVQDTSTTAINSVLSSVNYVLPGNVNVLTLTGTAALVGTGNAGNDLLTANSGADTLIAGNGNDTLVSATSTQIESLVGGTGNDLFVVNNAADVISIGGTHGADSIQSSVSVTLPTTVNSLTLLGSANLTGAAVSGANVITGNAGSDILKAGSGSDTLIAGSGVDTLIGGSGSDTFVVNSALDVLQSLSAAGNSLVSSVSYTLPTNVTALTLTGTANLIATGNAQTDVIRANAGNDTLTAGSGLATFFSGDGSDIFVVNNAADVVAANSDGHKYGADTVQSSVSYSLGAAVNTLILTGSANLSGTGNAVGASYSGDLLVGNAGLDILTAGIGTDTLVAGTGVATLIGAAGPDTFVVNNVGDTVQDSLTGYSNVLVSSVSYTLPLNVNALTLTGSGNLTATGNAANDSMTGNSGADLLIAGAGNDTLVSGSGIDTLVGGAGADVFVISNSADVVQSASASSGNSLFASVTYVLPTNVNKLTLTGVANISGTGNASADSLFGGAGNDTLIAGSGVATLVGGLGNTTFVVNSTADVVTDTSASANNVIQSSVNFTLATNVNTLVLTGTTGLVGTANSANDTLVSNTALDTLIGGADNETFVVNNTLDVVQDTSTAASNTAQASVNYALATNVNTLILTGTGALKGTANAGADTLISNSGVDTLIGGSGNDTFVVNNALDVVQDTSTTATNTIQSSVSYTLPTNVNALTLLGTGSLVATGNAATDVITANSGNDTLVAGTGAATLVGGAGNDTFVVNSSSDVVQDTSITASNTLQSSVSATLAANVNTLVLTGTSNLTGTSIGANDTLVSNAGVDTLVGGAGNDVFVVNNAADVILNATANDTIESSVNFTLPSNVNNLILIGSGNISGTGNANSDILSAGAGTDTLIAGVGVATLNGGTGNDTFVVNSGFDIVQDSTTTTSNTIVSSVSYTLPTNVDALTLTGSAALSATGNADAANVLTANSGNDILIGTAFSNTINGGLGSDMIEAGPEVNVIYAGNGGTTSQPTYVYGNASGTNITTQSTIFGGSGTDVLYGGPGSDVIYGGTGTDSIYGGTGFDSLYGTAGSNVIDSLGGFDLLVGGSGAETLSGTGLDTIVAGSGPDLLDNTGGAATPPGAGQSGLYQFNLGFGQDTIGIVNNYSSSPSMDDNLYFGTGIEPGSLTISAQSGPGGAIENAFQLVLTDGAGSIDIPGAVFPGVIGSVTFADTGSETFTQLMNADGPGTVTIPWLSTYNFVVSSGNSQSVTAGFNNQGIFAYGNNDTLASTLSSIYAYGDANTISGAGFQVYALGSGDLITAGTSESATLFGANDTLVGAGSNAITVYQASTVIQESAGSTGNSVASYISYTLPANVQSLRLAGGVDSLMGVAGALGGNLDASGNHDTLVGTVGSELINAFANNDSIVAGSGSDTLTAYGTYDSIAGGSGADTYVLYSPTDTVQFGSGNASLNSVQAYFSYTLNGGANTLSEYGDSATAVGNSANDMLQAHGRSDVLVAGSGNDTLVSNNIQSAPTTLVGGAGNDTFYVYDNGVIVDTSTTASNTVYTSGNYTLPTNVNTLFTGSLSRAVANSANDLMTTTGNQETLVAGIGNDTLVVAGAGGSDFLVAGSGTDVLEDSSPSGTSYKNTFVFNTGFGQSQIVTPQNGDIIQFGAGIARSSLTFTALPRTGGAAPSVVISGAGGSITVQGGLAPGAISSVNFTGGSNYTLQQLLDPTGRVTVPGANGNLILTSSNADSLIAGSGLDTVYAWGNNDTLKAGSGGTLIDAFGTGDQITGGAATDSLAAYGGTSTLTAGSGTETLVDNGSNDTLVGGAGNGYFYVNATSVVQVSAGVGHDTVFSAVSYTVPNNVSSLILTGTSSLTATANTGNDFITGNSGVDTFIDGGGADTFVGLGGLDSFFVNNPNDVVQELNAAAQGTLWSSVSTTLPTNVTTLNLQGSNLVGTGNSQSDYISSAYSGDTLVSGSAPDTIVAGTNSLIVINNSLDLVGAQGNDTLTSTASATIGGNSGNSVLNYWTVLGSANVAADYTGADYIQITGNSGNDTITGGFGATDSLIAGSGIATLIGSGASATNSFYVNNVADVVIGSPQDYSDAIYSSVSYSLPLNVQVLNLLGQNLMATGNSGSYGLLQAYGLDTLVAGSGNEQLNSTTGHGNNTLVAGAGSDVLYAYGGDTVMFNPGFGTSEVFYRGGSGAINIRFGAGVSASSLTATAARDAFGNAAISVSSGAGAILIDGSLSNHTYQFSFNGGANLTLAQFLSQVNVTTSSIVGASGNVILEGTPSVSLAGGTGNDTIYAAGAGDTLVAGSGNQVLDAVGSNDSIIGGSSADTLGGLGINDTLVAGAASDVLIAGTGASVTFVINSTGNTFQVQSSPGADTVQSSVAFSLPTGINTLILTGTSSIKGTANNGADTLFSNSGSLDTLAGGTGADLFVVNSSTDVVSVGGAHGVDTIQSSVSYTDAVNVANLILTGTAALSGTGTTTASQITANSGADTLTAGSAVTTLIGGSGNDTFVVNLATDVVQDTATTTTNVLSSSVSFSLPTNVNRLILTGTATVTGTANSANDTLSANSGTDTLVSGTGIDSLVGGSGNDTFVINNASDVVVDTSTTATNVASSSVSFILPTNVNRLILTGTAALVGTANAANDTLTANSGADTLISGTGTAVDSLVGGSGADLFIVNFSSDIVNVGATHGVDTIQSSVSYTNAANVANLVLTGTGALTGTGSATTASRIAANSGADTLAAGTAVVTLVGGAGNDTFVINSTSDVIQDTTTTTSNTLSSTVTYSLPTNVNTLIFTGTAALKGTANSGNDSLVANTGNDTLVAGSGADTLVAGTTGTDSLVGGSGNTTFLVNNTADIVTDTSTTASNTLMSTVTYSLPTNVNTLIFTGTAALKGTANSGNDSLVANTGNDTLVAGSGADTLVAGVTGTDSLVGGSGNDTFFVNNTADKVTDTSTTASNTIVSSVSYTLPANVQYLMLSGTAALAATGNTVLDLITGNTGNDTLTAGTGIAALEGGKTAGSDQIKATGNQAALIAGGGSSTLTGGAFKDFYAAGKVSDSITTGATANVISVNKGDGATTLQPTTSATNVLSLGAGIDTESLFFTKSGNDLILTDGVSGDSITFASWYANVANQVVKTLQVVEIASANYNSGGSDGLRNKALEAFNFTTLVNAYNTAGNPANWALSTAMPSAQLASSSTADYGGDLAYYFGLNGNLTGVNLSAVQSTLTNASFGTATQTIDAFGTITGGTGLHLLSVKTGPTTGASTGLPQPSVSTAATIDATPRNATPAAVDTPHSLTPSHRPELRGDAELPMLRERGITPHFGMTHTSRDGWSSFVTVTAEDAMAAVTHLDTRRSIEPVTRVPTASSIPKSYVDPINVAWLTLHGTLDRIAEVGRGTESTTEHDIVGTEALLAGAPLSHIRRGVTDPSMHSPLARERAL